MATTAAPATPSSGQSSGPGGRPQIKVGSNPNMNRRGIQSPVDGGANKRNAPHNKPWGQQNHSGGQQKYQVPNAMSNHKKPSETDTPDKHMNDRTIYLLANCVGKRVTATTKSGAQFSGIFAGSSTNGDFGCVLKFAKQIRGPQGEEDQFPSGYFGGGTEKTLVIEAKDLMDLDATDITLDSVEASSNQNGMHLSPHVHPPSSRLHRCSDLVILGAGQFKTDVDISGNQPIRERELQRWQADDTALGGLEESMEPHNPDKKWDQFETNERLFGVKSDFDENIYTTRIDTSHPMHKQREAAAAKIAREIETSSGPAGLSAHQAEERGLKVDDSGIDEEDKYSSVQRGPPPQTATAAATTTSTGSQKYMPPALRAQVSAPPAVQTPAPTQPKEATKEATKETTKETTKEPINEIPAATAPSGGPESATSKAEGAAKKPAPATTPAVPVIPVITEQAPSPQPPSVSSFKSEDSKPKDKAPLPESVKKASVAVPAVPVLPIHKTTDTSQQPTVAPAVPGSGTSDNPLRRVKDAFQQFTNTERERLEKRRQAMVKKDKDVKLQDLKKFAQSFKLNTPVPQDLVPILAKDKAKQDEIIEKSKVNAAQAHVKKQSPTTQTNPSTASGIQSNLRTPIPAPPSQTSVNNATGSNQNIQQPDKNGLNKTPIQGFPPRHPAGYRADRPQPLPANMNLPPAPGARLLSDKIRHNQQMKQTGQYGNLPVPIPVVEHTAPPPTGPAAMQPKPFSPTTNGKPNPRAMEFRPSPFAPVFTPGGTAPAPPTSSPAPSTGSRATSPSVFFGAKKPKALEERILVSEAFDPFKRMKLDQEQNKDKLAQTNADKSHMIQGFINKPWATLPTWQVREDNQEKKYSEIFEKSEPPTTSATPQTQPHQMNTHQPHHPPHPTGHPIPTHISQIPHMPHERHPAPHMPGFSGPTPHFGDQEHHGRHVSSPPNVLPSPSMQNANLPGQFGSPGPHHAMVYPNPGQMPPQYSNVLGQNGQFGGYRGGYAGGPQFMQPPAAAGAGSPMVMGQTQQPIPFMVPAPFIGQGLPQAMYSPHQMHAYPGQPAGPPPPPSGGYPSPGRGAPMMMHQSSQQGHQTPVPAPMMLSMSSGPPGHPAPHNMMRPFHGPPHFSQSHHPQNQYGQYPGGGRGGGGHPHHNAMPGHPSGPSSNIPHDNAEESK
ncbi:hypothetical protein Dda_0482 [Drechslerella dactyloides]|uniref:LsmAD domain-containing protein n=1 Tax=Drechslerella dactyloides TaxID=74499 RepID=A0AAD6NN29_DREDA|nr:hypothetical protein Dda_0482 [Drechslerella dactyloides]